MRSGQDSLVTLATVSTEMEAQVLVNFLHENNVDAAMAGGFTSEFRAEAPGAVRVLVKQDGLALAQSLLAERDQEQFGIEPAEDDTELSAYQPRLRRFGVQIVLILLFIGLVSDVVAWGATGDLIYAVWAVLGGVLLAVILLSRRSAKR